MKKIFILILFSFVFSAAVLAQDVPSATPTTSTIERPSSATKPKRGPVVRPTKDQIKQVQGILKNKKLYAGETNGTYNDETRRGIKGFQKDNGLKQTGTLNRATLEKFGIQLTETQKAIPLSPNSFETAATSSAAARSDPNAPKRTIFRATNGQIAAAQKLLKERSMYSGEETGKLDDSTRDGLKKFQEANGIKVTGTLNKVTLEKMGIELTDSQKASAEGAK